jgi:hypothetical protein
MVFFANDRKHVHLKFYRKLKQLILHKFSHRKSAGDIIDDFSE